MTNFREKSGKKILRFCDTNIEKLNEVINGSYSIFIERLNNNERIPFQK